MLNAGAIGSDREIERWNAELAFRAVVEATADKAGLEFLRHLVKNLAQSLGVAYAFVAEFAGSEDRVRTIAFWSRDDWAGNVEYQLSGTPCQRVIAGELCLYKDGIQGLFPNDRDLVALGARSYLGVPLRGANGQTLGHLAALDTAPMPDDPRGLTIFQVFANRARVELERLHAEAVLQRAFSDLEVRLEHARQDLATTRQSLDLAYGELRALLEINQSSTRHLDRTDLFAELARSVKPILPCERFGIEVPTGPETLRVHVLALDQPARGPMIEEFPSAGTACRWAQENRHWYVANGRAELCERFPLTFAVMEREGMESLCALPLLRETKSFGALFFMSTQRDALPRHPAGPRRPRRQRRRGRGRQLLRLRGAAPAARPARSRERLPEGRDPAGSQLPRDRRSQPALARVLSLVETVAGTSSTVLILGETGTGKELIARAIHDRSPRRDRPLVKVNCSAISAGLVESELFGHERGAFTGAVRAHTGRFEIAHGGTIFLDEVGELPLETQVKLLRVLQEREIEPVGSTRAKKVDVRVIAATNRDLEAEVAAGRFRADLFFRLNVFPIRMPPLRERAGDVELLVSYYVDRYARELGKRIDGVSRAALDRLLAYHWPGNVRELSNLIERAVVLATGPFLDLDAELPATVPTPSVAPTVAPENGRGRRLQEVERQHLLDTLTATNWTIEGDRGAAAQLGLRPSTLRSRMKRLGVTRPGD
ncbi:MAG: sigma 54-interacting transcriptional regulator [Candidatus Binatia bacterium]